jgi:hypothetical protein
MRRSFCGPKSSFMLGLLECVILIAFVSITCVAQGPADTLFFSVNQDGIHGAQVYGHSFQTDEYTKLIPNFPCFAFGPNFIVRPPFPKLLFFQVSSELIYSYFCVSEKQSTFLSTRFANFFEFCVGQPSSPPFPHPFGSVLFAVIKIEFESI